MSSYKEEINDAIKDKDLYFIGDALPSDWFQAFKRWLPLADAGDAKAQYNIGRCYRCGAGVDQDLQAAAAYYRKSMEQGDKRAPPAYYATMVGYYGDMAKAAVAQGSIEEAQGYLQQMQAQALASGPQSEHYTTMVRYYRDITKDAFALGSIEEAQGCLQQMRALALASGQKEKADDAALGMVAVALAASPLKIKKIKGWYESVTSSTGHISGGTTQYGTYAHRVEEITLGTTIALPDSLTGKVYISLRGRDHDHKYMDYLQLGSYELPGDKKNLELLTTFRLNDYPRILSCETIYVSGAKEEEGTENSLRGFFSLPLSKPPKLNIPAQKDPIFSRLVYGLVRMIKTIIVWGILLWAFVAFLGYIFRK